MLSTDVELAFPMAKLGTHLFPDKAEEKQEALCTLTPPPTLWQTPGKVSYTLSPEISLLPVPPSKFSLSSFLFCVILFKGTLNQEHKTPASLIFGPLVTFLLVKSSTSMTFTLLRDSQPQTSIPSPTSAQASRSWRLDPSGLCACAMGGRWCPDPSGRVHPNFSWASTYPINCIFYRVYFSSKT